MTVLQSTSFGGAIGSVGQNLNTLGLCLNQLMQDINPIVSSSSPIVLTNVSPQLLSITGSNAQSINVPVTPYDKYNFTVINQTNQVVSIYASNGTTLLFSLSSSQNYIVWYSSSTLIWNIIPLGAAFQTSSGSFPAVLVGWTIIGTAPTVTAHYEKLGNLCFVQIRIVPAGGLNTVAAIALTSTIAGLPFASGALPSNLSINNITTNVASGLSTIPASSTSCGVPLIVATVGTLVISGIYSLI